MSESMRSKLQKAKKKMRRKASHIKEVEETGLDGAREEKRDCEERA